MSTTTPTFFLSFLLHRIPWALFGMLACYMCFLFIKPDLLIYLRELLNLCARPCSGYGGCSNKQDNRRSQPPWRIHSGGKAEKSQTPCFYFSEACLDHHILRKTSLLLILLSFLPTLCPPLFFFLFALLCFIAQPIKRCWCLLLSPSFSGYFSVTSARPLSSPTKLSCQGHQWPPHVAKSNSQLSFSWTCQLHATQVMIPSCWCNFPSQHPGRRSLGLPSSHWLQLFYLFCWCLLFPDSLGLEHPRASHWHCPPWCAYLFNGLKTLSTDNSQCCISSPDHASEV